MRRLLRELLESDGEVKVIGEAEDGASGGSVIVRDEATSVVFGMPKAALELGAETRVVPSYLVPEALAESLADVSAARAEGRKQEVEP